MDPEPRPKPEPVGPYTYAGYEPTLEVLTWPNPGLNSVATEVDFDHDNPEFIAAELMTILANSKDGIGLAATQIGIQKRAIAVRYPFRVEGAVYDLVGTVLVNPYIEAFSRATTHRPEGCLSLPGVVESITRPQTIELSYVDARTREVHEVEFSGMLARIVQHEVDHLEGMMLWDRLPPHRREEVIAGYHRGPAETVEESVQDKIARQRAKRMRRR